MAENTATAFMRRNRQSLLFWGVLLLGAVLRLVAFPYLPLGFNQDEISAGYESYSLLHYGSESWGTRWPVYFTSGGGGQNVLYSYLNMPFIALFGMTALGTRTLAVIIGILTLPLLYATVKRWYTPGIALTTMAFTAVIPWHVMLSRWGLESNILPFVLLLGAWTVTKALQQPSRRTIIPALIPWAFALYAYGISIVVVAAFLILGLIIYLPRLKQHRWLWLVSLAPALIIVTPYLMFLANAYLAVDYPFQNNLPFGFPHLTALRLNDLQSNNKLLNPALSLAFILTGSNDHTAWNGLNVGNPVPVTLIILVLLELVRRVWNLRAQKPPRKNFTVFDVWLLACIPLLFLVPLNLNEANSIYLPLIVFAAISINRIYTWLRKPVLKIALAVVVAASLLIPIAYYFTPAYANDNASNFNPTLPTALKEVTDTAKGGQIYVTSDIPLAYLQVLWYQKIDPKIFRDTNPNPFKTEFANYVFDKSQLKGPYWFVTYTRYVPPCADPAHLRTYGDFKTGYCSAGA